jgi:hypothetical protein
MGIRVREGRRGEFGCITLLSDKPLRNRAYHLNPA